MSGSLQRWVKGKGITSGVMVAWARNIKRDSILRLTNDKRLDLLPRIKRVPCAWRGEAAADMKQCAPRCLYAPLSHLDYASRHGAGGEMEGFIHRLRSLPFPTAIPLHYLQEASLVCYLNKQTHLTYLTRRLKAKHYLRLQHQ